MLESLITILVVALVLWVIFFVIGKFVQGTPLQIVGIILALVFLVYALRELDLIRL